jgi:hypothetical protein
MINSYMIYRRSIELLNEQIQLLASEQNELDKYRLKPDHNLKFSERRQLVINKRLQSITDLETLVTGLYNSMEAELNAKYSEGFRAAKKSNEEYQKGYTYLSVFDTEGKRARSIAEAQEKYNF